MIDESTEKLLSDLLSPRNEHSSVKCKLSVVKSLLPDEAQKAIDNCVELIRNDKGQGKSKTYSVTWLYNVLRKNGHSVSVSTIQRHVNKGCACERFAE